MLQQTYPLRADEPLLSVAQVADLLNVSRLTVYRLIERRLLPVFRVARRLRFAPDDVRRYLDGVRAHDDYAGAQD